LLALEIGLVYPGTMTTSTGIEIPSPPLPTEEEKHQMTLEALKSLDEGHVISNEAMQVWFDTLEARLASKSQ